MPDIKPVDIISDNPEKETVQFGFEAYAKTIADLIANKNNKTPFVIGVYGSWGSGKTTLMSRIKHLLENDAYGDKTVYRKIKTVWFQAWKYNDEDAILAALIEEIFKTMKRSGFLDDCKAQIERMAANTKYQASKIVGKLTKLAGLDISELFADLEYKKKLGFFDVFQEFFDRLIWDYLNWRPQLRECEKTDDRNAALVIFIDDLDRCPEPRIVKVLETVKLFMDKEGCVFVIGAANEIIQNALKPTYGEIGAARFMDKIVQVVFHLKQIPANDLKSWVEALRIDFPNKIEIVPHIPLLAPALQNNPRQLKRFLNNLALLAGIIENKNLRIDFIALLYFCIFEYVFPEFVEDLKDNPNILFLLKDEIHQLETKTMGQGLQDLSDAELSAVPASLRRYIKNRELNELVVKFPGRKEELVQLTTLSGMVELPDEIGKVNDDIQVLFFDEMILVETGHFLYDNPPEEETIDQPYYIDIYPVTNEQYRKFMDDGGYSNKAFWSEDGFEWKNKNNITCPKYLNDEKWNKDGHPVVGVSYYEAEAYAKWEGKNLPTELEWERAARGTDGRQYPWGDEYDKERCNTRESEVRQTSRVTRYPNGISPMGCYDMAGNVWEWTRSLYEESDRYVLRGGSWYNYQKFAACAMRNSYLPNFRYYTVGFRCARTIV